MLEIFQVLDNHAGKAIGLDVSEWENQLVDVDTLKINIPFTLFSFGPPGNDRLDKQFDENWRGAKSSNLIREPITYRPNENSLEAATH
jgi:lysozyme